MTAAYDTLDIPFSEGKYLYFASDFHLGAPSQAKSIQREKKIVQWLEDIAPKSAAIFLVGDIFDFWFEYKEAVPKGSVRLLGCLAKIRDSGVPVFVFTGNHDIWMFDFFPKELGIPVFRQPQIIQYGQQKLFVGHGDGLGPGDTKFKILKKVFTFPIFQWMFNWLHPDIGIKIARSWSNHSRTDPSTERFMGEDKEWLYQYAVRKSGQSDCRYYIFGHRHLPLQLNLPGGAEYINLGDWIVNFTYLEVGKTKAELKKYAE